MAGTKLVALSAGLLLFARPAWSLDVNNTEDIIKTSKSLAKDLVGYYKGNESGEALGLLEPRDPDKDEGYYWYQSGIFMSTLIDYWHLTGDDTYNDLVAEGMAHQSQEGFLPANQTLSIGNDDQGVWAHAALTAVEYGLPETSSNETRWFDLAVDVFEQQRSRWDNEKESDTCGGGLRWTIAVSSPGHNYKSTTSNVQFFNLCSRLARITGNETYAEYADEAWNWLEATGIIDSDKNSVYSGASVEMNCTDTNKITISTDAVLVTFGAASMYNYTNGSSTWESRVEDFSDSMAKTFFPNGTLAEVACKPDTCPQDFLAYHPIIYRSIAVTAEIAPFTAEKLQPLLNKAAEAVTSDDYKVEKNVTAITAMIKLSAVSNLLMSSAEVDAVEIGDETAEGNGTETDSSDSEESSEVPESGAAKMGMSLLSVGVGIACMYLI